METPAILFVEQGTQVDQETHNTLALHSHSFFIPIPSFVFKIYKYLIVRPNRMLVFETVKLIKFLFVYFTLGEPMIGVMLHCVLALLRSSSDCFSFTSPFCRPYYIRMGTKSCLVTQVRHILPYQELKGNWRAMSRSPKTITNRKSIYYTPWIVHNFWYPSFLV